MNLNQEANSKFSDNNLSASEYDAVQIKNDDIDIFYEDIKGDTGEEPEFLDHKHATDAYQKQNQVKLDATNLNQLVDHLKCSDNLSNECEAIQIKNEDNSDIFPEGIKSETGEKTSSQGFEFCQVCYQNFDVETDIFISTRDRFKCSCQKQNESMQGEDMTFDVKRTSLGHTTVLGLKPLEVQDETISRHEVNRRQDSSTVSRRRSVPSVENDNKIKRKLCSNPFENNPIKHQMKDKTEEIFRCKLCSRSFNRMGKLKVHERCHTGEKPFQCKTCSKSFRQKGHLKAHGMIHTGEKPFHCQTCSKSFNKKSSLNIHLRSHTGEKPFHCETCSKSFARIDHFKVYTDKRPFHCKLCSKSFNRMDTLKIHERSHTGRKPFQCQKCSKSFSRMDHLKSHELRSHGEKLFHCKTCLKSFSRTGDLKVHERSHTGEKPFHCKICSKSFSQGSTLKVHQMIHTDEKPFHC